MRLDILIGAALVGGSLGCDVVSLPSNHPASEISCNALAPDAGGVSRTTPSGSGTLTGDRRFDVRASYQGRQQAKDGNGNPSGEWLWFGLYAEQVTCAGLAQKSDGGPDSSVDGGRTTPMVAAFLYDRGRNTFPPGAYPIRKQTEGDGGMSATLFVGGTLAEGGVVNLGAVEACAITGTFTATFGAADAGSTPLEGSFSSAFCE